ncbi:hypothetical protein [Kribbella sp. CA-293567]|uniref:hypothetical protein n=1 Tax=Kribbella sp. CA-293567 TaxID=3002436 RepID=UPI0022DD5B30|nr:hypothetical protein [Kribbella sp. CA-293567]WBQ05886.1 hypothetical protein OX958_03570 [Kribbella sp. CA-293567]
MAEAVAGVQELREDPAAPYDFAVALPAGTDPRPYAEAGATWSLTDFEPVGLKRDVVEAVVAQGPFR